MTSQPITIRSSTNWLGIVQISGEIACTYASRTCSRKQAMLIAYHRGRLPGTRGIAGGLMAATGLSAAEATQRLEGSSVVMACDNSPVSTTISGAWKHFQSQSIDRSFQSCPAAMLLWQSCRCWSLKCLSYSGGLCVSRPTDIQLYASSFLSTNGNKGSSLSRVSFVQVQQRLSKPSLLSWTSRTSLGVNSLPTASLGILLAWIQFCPSSWKVQVLLVL